MSLEASTLVYAGTVGAASFFSPCSAGLLPGYIGYHFTNDESTPWAGVKLGAIASAGFLALFAVMAIIIRLIPLQTINPILPWASLTIGFSIILLGVYLLLGGPFNVRLPQVQHNPRNVFLFGIAYAFASLGCTFPLFLSVALAGASTGDSSIAAMNIIAYAIGMAIVMVALTTAISISQAGATRFMHRAIPIINKAAPIVMIAGGAYILYYWIKALQVTT